MFLFEFPQNLIGYLLFILLTKGYKKPYYKYKEAYITHIPGRWGAISLSRFIFADDIFFESPIIKHEYGHTIQSKKLLVFYLPVIGLPSFIWNKFFNNYRKRTNKSYYSFYTESWANKLGGYILKNKKDGANN